MFWSSLLKFLEAPQCTTADTISAEKRWWFGGWFSVFDFRERTFSPWLSSKWRRRCWQAQEREKTGNVVCLPVPTVETGAPFNKEFCRLLFVGENGAGGEDCRYRSQACSHHKKFGHRSDCRPRLVWYSARWLIRVIHSSCRDHVWNWKSSIATNNRGEVVFPCCYETCEMSHYHLLSWWQIGFCTDLSIQLNAFKLPRCLIGFWTTNAFKAPLSLPYYQRIVIIMIISSRKCKALC